MPAVEKAKTLMKPKAVVKDHLHELQANQMGNEAAVLGDLDATSLFRTDLIINLNSPFQTKTKGSTVYKMW